MIGKVIGKTVAIIPARGGSKSIPLKNIKSLNGRPLIFWTLDATTECPDIDTVVVATDSEEIADVVESYNSEKVVIIGRSESVSTDSASTESVLLEFAEDNNFDTLILVQATSPLLTSEDLSMGLNRYLNDGYGGVISVVRQKRFIWEESDNCINPKNYDFTSRPRRQEFSGYLVENGAFYITSKKNLVNSRCRISGRIGYVEMSEDSYFELDEPSQWEVVEFLLMKKACQKRELKERLSNVKCVLTDCDGVLTDGGMYYSVSGDEQKKFNTRDGMGFLRLKQKGIITGIVSGEDNGAIKRRAEKLLVDELHMGIKNKVVALDAICKKYNFSYSEVVYIGDDINDLNVIERVSFGCTVNDATQEIKSKANYITKVKGGEGAFREVAELVINSLEGIRK